MKRDMRLIRRLLLAVVQGAPSPAAGDAEILAEHYRLLEESGFVASDQGVRQATPAGLVVASLWADEGPFLAVMQYLEAQLLPGTAHFLSATIAKYGKSVLVARRIDLGLSQEQIAHRAGLQPSTISRCEHEVRLPQSLVAVRSYAAALQLTEAALRELVTKPIPAMQEA